MTIEFPGEFNPFFKMREEKFKINIHFKLKTSNVKTNVKYRCVTFGC